MKFGFTASRAASGYIALSVLALALFAIPLWYGFRANQGTFRAYVPGEEMQRLADIFQRDGATAMARAIEAQARSLPGDQVVLFAAPSKELLAGNLPAWPPEVPDAPGAYGLVISIGGGESMRVVASHVRLAGGYHLLMGRESVRFESLVARFWYGIAGAVAIILALGAAFAWLLRRAHGELEGLVARRTAQLGESEERYARAMDAAEAGHWEWDVPADEFYVSPKLLEMTDFAPGTRFAGRADFMTRAPFHPDDRTKWERAVKELFASGGTRLAMEIRSIHGGETRWALLSGMCARDAAGKILRWTGSATDITARKRAEVALRQSEERYARVMQASEDGFWEWVVATDEFYASPRMLAIYGLPQDTVFRGRADFLSRFPFHPEDLGLWRNAVAAHLAGETARIDIEVRAELQSETRWIHLTAICLRDAAGAEERWTGSVSDVTERRRAQEGLRVSEERYARAMEGSGAGHWDWNIVSDEMFVSERAREMLALPAGALPARRSDIMALAPMHPDDRAAMSEAVNAGIQSGIHERDYRVIPRPGEVRWLRARAKVYKDARGAAVRMTGSLIDITERKLAADALTASEERYSLAMDASAEGHFDTDLDTGEMFISARLNEIYGFPRHANIVNRVEFLNQIPFHPDDRHLLAEIIRPDWEDPTRDLYEFECRIVPRPGETRWIHTRGKVTRDAEGRARRRVGVVADITARKLAEEALRASEERYALAVAGASDGIWDEDLVTGMLYRSPRNQEIALGRPSDGIDVRRRAEWAQWHHVHPDDAPKRDAAMRAHLEGRTPLYEIEYRVRHPDGTYHWIHARGVCTRDASGRALRIAGSTTNIDARKAAEEALRASEERYALAVAGSDAGVWDYDFVARRHFSSARARELGGLPPEPQALAMTEEGFAVLPLHPEDAPRRVAAMRAHLAGETPMYEGEFRVRQPDGSYRWRRIQGLCVRDADGKPLRLAGSISDIDARKRAEDALRLSEERYALALEASEEGHFDNDLETGEIFVSARLNEMYGFPRQARIANRIEFLNQIPFHPDDRHVLAELMRPDWQDPAGDLYEFECRIVPRPGETRWIHSRAKVVRDAEGRARRRVGVVADITARKHAEEALRLSEKRYALAMEVAEEGHFDWNVQTDEIFASARALSVVGAPPDAKYRTRCDVMARVRYHPDDGPRVQAEWRAALDGRGVDHEFEYRILRGEEPRWVRGRWKVFRDEAGVALRVIGVVADITERKRAADELRESEARFRGLTALWSDWYWRQDENLRFTYSSAAIDPPDGYPGGSAIGKTRWELPGIVPVSSSWAEHQEVLAARKPFRDFEYSRPADDGTMRYVSTSGAPIFDERSEFRGYHGVGRNITERKRSEEALRESEARFRDLTELSSDWYWEQDENLRFTYLSNQAEPLTGYSGESSLGKTRWEIANMTPLTCSWAEHQAVLAARQPFRDLECRRVGPDGTVRYLSMSGAPIFDADGRFKGYRGIGRNITARKLAAEAVRESEARFRSLTELSSDWYWEQDENMRFTYTSRQLTETTAYPSEWVIGKTRWELPGLTPLSFTWPEHQAALAARQPFRDLEYARTGLDATRYVSISGAPIFDEEGVFRGYRGIGRDITERKRIEEELRSRQEMLELAQKSARAIAFEWRIGADGPDRNRWSPELAAMYGLGPESYDGSFEQWKQLIHPEDWPAVTQAIKHAQRTGEVSAEYRVVHPDASVHWLHARGRMFFDAAGTAVRMVGFMHDVTERRRAEDELKAMERKLRQAQRLEAMGTLAGGIAHDFNNILGAILGYGEMALRDAPKGSRLARDLDSIVTAGERGRALVDRVLAFSRSGVGERAPVHVEKVVREALDLVSAKLPPDVTLHAKLHAGRAAMLGDATQVHQVLMNLASNAIQAMPSGGTLRVSLGAVRLEAARAPTIGILDPGNYLVLEVADSGTGIAPDILDRIFDPFFTTKEVGTGTGLGLSLVHGIVAEVGGAIDVASRPGAGSTFTVYLPRSGDALDSSQKEEPELPRGDGQRVLVVDDEEPLVKLATRTLEELGYAPVGFTSSAAALAAFRAEPQRFDVVITDERMPGMSGSALIREVRGIRDRIPIVLMSGYVGGALATRAREAGAEEVLKKPLSARDLAASLAKVLHPSH